MGLMGRCAKSHGSVAEPTLGPLVLSDHMTMGLVAFGGLVASKPWTSPSQTMVRPVSNHGTGVHKPWDKRAVTFWGRNVRFRTVSLGSL
eukprot:2344665-Prymnesium_polylepis.1